MPASVSQEPESRSTKRLFVLHGRVKLTILVLILVLVIPSALNYFASGSATSTRDYAPEASILAPNVSALPISYNESKIQTVSRACDQNSDAEVEQAVDPSLGYVYESWMGCNGIGFARSTDGGLRFDPSVSIPQSGGPANSWDPAIAVSPKGIVFVSFMRSWGGYYFPIVEASFDHGLSFPQVSFLIPPSHKNWGYRDFIAVAANGRSSIFVPKAEAVLSNRAI